MKSRLLHIALLLLTVAFQAKADNLGFTKQNPLIFGMDMDYPPLQYVNPDGIPEGKDVAFTQELMRRMNIPFTYASNTWGAIAGDILHGKVDLGMMVYSSYRKDSTNYSRAVFRMYYQILYRANEKSSFDIRNLSGKTIAFMSSRPVKDTLEKIGAKTVIVTDISKAILNLSEGYYDALICFRHQAKFLTERYNIGNLLYTDLTLMPREYCYVSNNKELIDAINKELDKMEQEGVINGIYGVDITSEFGSSEVPLWIWYLVAFVVFASLITVIFFQRKARKRLMREMKRAQESEELARQNEQKAKENEERARKSEELKDVFLSNVSHALRTPLNAVIGFSDLLMSTPEEMLPNEERQQLYGLINDNGLQLLHLINELLTLSDIEVKDKLFERQVIDVDQEMRSYAAEIRPQLSEGVAFVLNEPMNGIRAVLDNKMMRTVTMHLLENAQQHTQFGAVELSYYVKEGGLYVEVKDTGEGLPDPLKKNIFALLSDKNTYTQEEVPGLGLSVLKAIIDKSGGKVGYKDNEEAGRGCIFWYWAPVQIVD
ncbi:MAG: transporter substrate-binding domain-containing protein [Prevotella sp.]|nr:transporter substrate-binding domain-containing protein [Prevotella sp.]